MTDRPPWRHVERALTDITQVLDSDPKVKQSADQLQAYLRDTFDSFGLILADETTVYTVIVAAGIFLEMLANGHRHGAVSASELETGRAVVRSLIAGLLDYVPEEARR